MHMHIFFLLFTWGNMGEVWFQVASGHGLKGHARFTTKILILCSLGGPLPKLF